MPKRAIVTRQVTAQVIGPDGPVDVGKWDEANVSDEIKQIEHECLDGTTEYLVDGFKYSGTLKRGVYDAVLSHIVWDLAHPGDQDPPRHLLLVTEKYNDGSTEMRLYKEVLFSKRGETIGRGSAVTEDIDWVAEDMEVLT